MKSNIYCNAFLIFRFRKLLSQIFLKKVKLLFCLKKGENTLPISLLSQFAKYFCTCYLENRIKYVIYNDTKSNFSNINICIP